MSEFTTEHAALGAPLKILVAEDSAAKHLAEGPDVPDLVFLDQNMPHLSAMEILRELPHIQALPYCIITGSAIEKDQWVKELGLSPHCYILKPLTQAKLVEFLQACNSLRPLGDSIEQSSSSLSSEAAPPVP